MAAAGLSWFLVSALSLVLKVGAVVKVSDVSSPVCLVVNGSLDCPLPCLGGLWEVTVLLMGMNGTTVSSQVSTDLGMLDMIPDNVTSMIEARDATEENDGYNGTLLTYTGSCCRYKVKISAFDSYGNEGPCDFAVRFPNVTTTQPTVKSQPRSGFSSSSKITVQVWTTALLLALTALLL